jgi:hypothetical protein
MKKMIFNKNVKSVLLVLLCASMLLVAFPMASCNKPEGVVEGAADDGEYVNVLRVIDDVKYGGKFTNDKLETVRVRADAAPADAITTTADLRNKYAASTIPAGDFITPAKLLDKKPADATDEDEDDKTEELDYKALGYVVLSDYQPEKGAKGYAALINKVIAENPGRTIYIPDGRYMIEEPIVIPADPAKSVSLRLGNQTVLVAATDWADPYAAMIRVAVEEPTEAPLTMAEFDAKNYRSISILGGCLDASSVATGISIEGGKDTYIYNVSIKSSTRGIHIFKGNNELGATWANVDNCNVTGTDKPDSVGVLIEGTYNTVSNMRIYLIRHGIRCTETGERNILRNLHPLASAGSKETIGFYDQSNGNNFDVCYSDQFASGYAMHENTRSVMNGGFCYWYSEANNYHVGYKAMGKFNSIIVSGKVSHGHAVATDAYLYIEQEGGQGVVLYPIDSTQNDMHKNMLVQHCPTPIIR